MKISNLTLIMTSLLIISACSNDQEAEGENDSHVTTEFVSESSETEKKVIDILERMEEAEEGVDNLSFVVTADQIMEDDGLETDLQMEILTDIMIDPFTGYMKQTIESNDFDEELIVEAYFKDEESYFYNNQEDQWQHFSGGSHEDIFEEQMGMNAEYLLINHEVLFHYLEEIALTEYEDYDYFILTLTDPDAYDDLYENPPTDEEMVNGNGKTSADSFTYTVEVDKDTYLPVHIESRMTGTRESDGETLSIQDFMHTQIIDVNETDTITVPEEVEDEAVEADE